MLAVVEKLADYLYGYRRAYWLLGAVIFLGLFALALMGIDDPWLLMLSFLWYFFIANFVGMMRDRHQEIERNKDLASTWFSKFLASNSFKIYVLLFHLIGFWVLLETSILTAKRLTAN